MRIKITKEYIFDKDEVIMIVKCLTYCKHRLNNHPNSGIEKVLNEEEIKFIKEFKYFN